LRKIENETVMSSETVSGIHQRDKDKSTTYPVVAKNDVSLELVVSQIHFVQAVVQIILFVGSSFGVSFPRPPRDDVLEVKIPMSRGGKEKKIWQKMDVVVREGGRERERMIRS
jgi:hypothetical protein